MYEDIFKTNVENCNWSIIESTDINMNVNKFCKVLANDNSESVPLRIIYVTCNQSSKISIIPEVKHLVKVKYVFSSFSAG